MIKELFILSLTILLFPGLVLASDYTQTCLKGGAVFCDTYAYCEPKSQDDCPSCHIGDTCESSCPSPSKEHSHFVDKNCVLWRNCPCNSLYQCSDNSGPCQIFSGSCNYACDEGYRYESGSCVLNPKFFYISNDDMTEIMVFSSGLFSDAKFLILLAIGIPLGFYVIIRIAEWWYNLDIGSGAEKKVKWKDFRGW